MDLPSCLVIDPLNCFITRDIAEANRVRPYGWTRKVSHGRWCRL